MEKRVPRKNIQPVLVDVKKPDGNYGRISRIESVNLSKVPRAPAFKFFSVGKIAFGIVVSALVLIALWAGAAFLRAGEIKKAFAGGVLNIAGNFSLSIQALKETRFGDAEVFLAENDNEIRNMKNIMDRTYGSEALKIFGFFIPRFRNAADILEDAIELNSSVMNLASELEALTLDGMKNFQTNGALLIQNISAIRSEISGAGSKLESVRNNLAALRGFSDSLSEYEQNISGEYLKYSGELNKADIFLGGILGVLRSNEERHIAVLFQNTAEIRPGGGFVGSYADIIVQNGQMKSMDVRDIYDPDGQLDLKIVPPQEIKTMSTDWGARDANWFFDFPSSARAILFFLENSKMYSERDVKFDAAVGLNINVFESFLSATGPIELEDYKLAIDNKNFLKEIQREVETGADKRAGEPKRILKTLAPLALEKMNSVSELEREALAKSIFEHVAKKDIMIYAKDNNIQSSLVSSGVAGETLDLPNSFWGSYLAVVNANIAGGKTDVFMEQSVDARVDVDSEGGVFTDLSVNRKHTGNKEKDPWWRETNKNFIQIYAAPGSSLVSVKGNDVKNIVSKFDYEAEGYETYPELKKIEDSKIYSSSYQTWAFQAFGKSVFGTWFNVQAGKERVFSIKFETPPSDKTAVAKGRVFTFIFESQSGVSSKLKVAISAPLGYIWEESRSPFFNYETSGAAAREMIYLTLGKR